MNPTKCHIKDWPADVTIDLKLDNIIVLPFFSAGPLRSVSAHVHCLDWRVQVMGDVGGWGAYGGSKEARVTLKHTLQGQTSPALQVRITHTHKSHRVALLCLPSV